MSEKKPIKIRKIDLILKLHTIFVIISISSNMNKEKSLLNILVVLCNIVFNDLRIWFYDLSKIFMLLRQSQTKYELNRSQKLKTFTTLRFLKKSFQIKRIMP